MKKRILKEWAGAGFSYGSSIYPSNRGGQANRGGFGGASNLGGPNMMYTYEIKPLNRLLQPKDTDYNKTEQVHDGHYIEGQELNKKNGKLLRGTIIKTERTDKGSLMFYVILDDKTHTKIKIDPTTVVLLSGENYVDTKNMPIGLDKPDLKRAGQTANENYSEAKIINEDIDELKIKLHEVSDLYDTIKKRAYAEYLDPIDFPYDIKNRLQQLSRQKSELKRQIDPSSTAKKEDKQNVKYMEKRISNISKMKQIKKETLEKFPDIKIASEIYNLWEYNRKLGSKKLSNSKFENISRVKEYVLNARQFMKQLKQENKAIGHLPF